MPRSLPLRPGCAYSFLYPRYNYVGLPARTERRRIMVESVRDTRAEPLDETTMSLNPSLRRGRWLVSGIDLDREDTRSFYAESMTDVQPLTEQEREPLRDAEFVVLSSAGRAAFHAGKLSEAIAFLLGRRRGVLCKVLGLGPDRQEERESA